MQDAGGPQMEYSVFNLGQRGIAGLMPLPEDYAKAGGRPAWMGYILVDDVDAMAARIQQEGGKLHKGPITVPGIIRFAVVSDPQGAGFLIARPLGDARAAAPRARARRARWAGMSFMPGIGNRLSPFMKNCSAGPRTRAMDMGPMGIYQLFKTGGDYADGGMMTKPAAMPVPYWGYYFNVDALDAATARVTAGGGKILNGPMQVPGSMWVANCMDPKVPCSRWWRETLRFAPFRRRGVKAGHGLFTQIFRRPDDGLDRHGIAACCTVS